MARPRGYSEDLKAAVLEEIDAGEPVAKVAEKYGVSRAIPYRWLQRREKERAGPPPLGSYHARIHLVIDVSAARPIVAAVPAGHREATKAWLRASLEEKVLADLIPRLRQDLRAQIVAEVEKLEGGAE